ncbi:unnamed protein product, partial [Phaeothamnion confervicola]
MAMPVRSSRNTGFGTANPTPAAVGPGSYEPSSRLTYHAKPVLRAFLSSAPRDFQRAAPAGVEATPGPGSYARAGTPSDSHRYGAGSAAFASRAPRTGALDNGGGGVGGAVPSPGPGDYYSPPPMGTPPARRRCGGGAASRVNPPAIPRREQSHGYCQDAAGRLAPLPAAGCFHTGERGDTVGPGAYTPSDYFRRSGGACARMLAGPRRTVFDEAWAAGAAVPGPGDYQPALEPLLRPGGGPASAPFRSAVPKMAFAAADGPGPGEYDIAAAVGMLPSAAVAAGTALGVDAAAPRHGGFGSTTEQRGVSTDSAAAAATPGPGHYAGAAQSSFAPRQRKTLREEPVGFYSTAERPCL